MTSTNGPSIPGQPEHGSTPTAGRDSEPDAGQPHDRPDRRPSSQFVQRRLMVVALVLALVLAAGFSATMLIGGGEPEPEPLPPGAVWIDTWVPYWALDDALPVAEDRLDGMREVSPFWFSVDSALQVATDEFAPIDETEAMIKVIRDDSSPFVPSIRDELPAGDMAKVLADPTLRRLHIDELLEFADEVDADGLDLDYERFAFSDGRETWEITQPNWVTFVAELSAELRERDLTLTVSIPPVYDAEVTGDRGYWVYDHGAIAEHVDFIRIMTYDYSVAEAGPIAPLSWVQQSIDGVSAAVAPEYHDKLVLGVPAYGTNWVVGTTGTCPDTAEGRTNVTSRTALELAERRAGVPVLDPVDLEWSFTYDLTVTVGDESCVQHREVRWVDAEGAAARVHLARRAGWGGVGLWAFGYEDDEVWDAIARAAVEDLPVDE